MFRLLWTCFVYNIIATSWRRYKRRTLAALGCQQHEQPLQHRRCEAIHFSPGFKQQNELNWIETEEKTPTKRKKSKGMCTWMLLWAKKGQNAEWKLTSTFFHSNCCKPRIISSVYQPNTSLLCHVTVTKFSSNKSFTSSFLVDWYVPSIISWYSIVFCVLGAFCAASFALAASGG